MTDPTSGAAAPSRSLTVGVPVYGADGHWGRLGDIVIDPVRWCVTHVVVEPHHRHEQARLIPVDAIVAAGDRLDLAWTTAQIEAAPLVSARDFIQLGSGSYYDTGWGIEHTPVSAWPYWPASPIDSFLGYGYTYGAGGTRGTAQPAVITTRFDRLPRGTVEVRRASPVISADDHTVGHVDGFLIDAAYGITHLVLERGHLWGHREITIPLADVDDATTDEVRLSITRQQVGELPSVPFDRHRW
ncbi:MAG: hypothetical protein R2761_01255 [Acidimicrobiales bacterium]